MATSPAIIDPRIRAFINAAPIDTESAPTLNSTIAMPSASSPSIGSTLQPTPVNAFPTQTQSDTTRRNQLINSGDGISQIKNPLLRGIARAGDVLGSVFAPNLAMAIPGTTLHHDMLVGQQDARVKQDQAAEQAAAQTGQTQAVTRHVNDEANALETPKGPEYDYVDGPNGKVAILKGSTSATPVTLNGQPLSAPIKPKTIEDQAYDFAIKSGKNPLDAYAAVFGAKNTKTDNLPEQYLEAMQSGDTAKADLIRRTIHDTQVQPKIDIHTANAPAAPTFSPGEGGSTNPTIQAYIDGRIPAPNARTRQGAEIMRQITAADPTYDATRYATYQAAQRDATSGKTGAAINSLNTIQEHIGRALQNIPNNGSSPFLNSIENTLGSATGSNPTGKFDVDATGIAGEWGKLVAGGVASEGEQKHVQSLLNKNGSPQQIRENLEEVRQMTLGKLQGIQRQIASASHPGSANNPITSLPSSTSQGGSGMAVSLKDAMALPQNSGKSEADVRNDIQAHGHTVKP